MKHRNPRGQHQRTEAKRDAIAVLFSPFVFGSLVHVNRDSLALMAGRRTCVLAGCWRVQVSTVLANGGARGDAHGVPSPHSHERRCLSLAPWFLQESG